MKINLAIILFISIILIIILINFNIKEGIHRNKPYRPVHQRPHIYHPPPPCSYYSNMGKNHCPTSRCVWNDGNLFEYNSCSNKYH